MKFFKKIWPFPIHCFLVPTFFLFHNFIEFYNIVDFDILTSSIIIWFFLPGMLILVYIQIFKNVSKASLITTILLILFFFTGPLIKETKNILYIHSIFRYSVLIPALLLIVILLNIWLYKSSKAYKRTHTFIAFTLLVLIMYDVSRYFFIVAPNKLEYNLFKSNDLDLTTLKVPPDSSRPDIYYLIFDEMPSSYSLKTLFQYDNSYVSDSLENSGFLISPFAHSAYPSTPLSLASNLNLTDLGFPANNMFTFKEYSKADVLVRNNQLVPFLHRNGYRFINASIFNIRNNPSSIRDYININRYATWGMPENMIRNQTLFRRIHEDIGWNFRTLYMNSYIKQLNKDLRNEVVYTKKINLLIDSCLNSNHKGPVFFYGHFFLPHQPYKIDSLGNLLQWTPENYKSTYKRKENYISQVKYSGKLIFEIGKKIISKSTRPVVVVIQGDHGHRDFDEKNYPFMHKVSIFSAIYFSDRNYQNIPPNLYAPNTFRMILNKYFDTGIPLIKDSSVLITEQTK